jgi:hypothetical protein
LVQQVRQRPIRKRCADKEHVIERFDLPSLYDEVIHENAVNRPPARAALLTAQVSTADADYSASSAEDNPLLLEADDAGQIATMHPGSGLHMRTPRSKVVPPPFSTLPSAARQLSADEFFDFSE